MKLIRLMIMLQMVSNKDRTKVAGKTPTQPGYEGDANRPAVPILNVEVTIPLKYLSNFRRFFDLPLINCEIELIYHRQKTVY